MERRPCFTPARHSPGCRESGAGGWKGKAEAAGGCCTPSGPGSPQAPGSKHKGERKSFGVLQAHPSHGRRARGPGDESSRGGNRGEARRTRERSTPGGEVARRGPRGP
eukprot:4621613-Prymnesium_polylepis.2